MQLLSIVPKPGETLMSGVIAQTFTDVDLRAVPALTLWKSVSRNIISCALLSCRRQHGAPSCIRAGRLDGYLP